MNWVKKYSWVNLSFYSLITLASIAGLAIYIPFFGIHPLEPIITVIFIYLVALVVSGGYHRYFTHKAFQCNTLIKILYLILGAAAFQQSALTWASDHRRHHRYLDTEMDPYSITKGFWWAHIGWVFAKETPGRQQGFVNVPDLKKDKWVLWQHRYLYWIAIPLAFGIPLAIGFMIGRPLGMFLWAGLLRVVITHQTTFLINSATHKFGKQPYSDQNSGREVWWLSLFFLCGEHYHNFHHCFQADYRNGTRWYHWDPTKWSLWLLSHLGLVDKLKRTPPHLIWRARVEMDFKRLEKKMVRTPSEFWQPWQERLLRLRKSLEERALGYTQAWKNYFESKQHLTSRSRESLRQARLALRQKEKAFKAALGEWRETLHLAGQSLAGAFNPLP